MDKWIIAVGKHKGIVSGKEWVAIQDTLTGNKPGNQANPSRNDYSLLSGLIYCSICEEKLFSKPRSNNPELFDYMCSSKIKGGMSICGCPNLNGKQADEMVCQWLQGYVHEDSGIFILLENMKKELLAQTKTDPFAEAERQIADRNAAIDSLMNTLSQPALSPSFIQRINSRITTLDEELLNLQEGFRSLQEKKGDLEGWNLKLEVLANSLSSFQVLFESLSVPEKRFIIRLLIPKIQWDGKSLQIFLYGE